MPPGLAHLCEFIEDCEHTVLATKILHLLGREGPRTPTPSKYIRFIYNRVILENAAVRAGESSLLAVVDVVVRVMVIAVCVRCSAVCVQDVLRHAEEWLVG